MTKILGTQNSKTPKALVKPKLEDIAWAAGFIEGEGCFHNNGSSHRVNACQKNKEPLLKLQTLFGGVVDWKTTREGIWEWRTYGSRARGIMLTLYPFLSKRRKEQITKSLKN